MNKLKLIILGLAVIIGVHVSASTPIPSRTMLTTTGIKQVAANEAYIQVNPLDLVARPNFYMNKYVKVRAKFDKFSTLVTPKTGH